MKKAVIRLLAAMFAAGIVGSGGATTCIVEGDTNRVCQASAVCRPSVALDAWIFSRGVETGIRFDSFGSGLLLIVR